MMLLAALVGLLFGASILLAISAWTTPPAPVARSRDPRSGRVVRCAAIGVAAGVVGLVVSGWLAFAAGATAGTGWLAWTYGERQQHLFGDRERLEALAAWCEQLRDLIRARQGAIAPIIATRDTAPAAIRPQVIRLAAGLRREDPQVVFARFAAELDDPDADLVASVLALSMTHSGRTSDLLNELAVTIRERAAIRIRIDTSRAGDRTEARFVTAVAVAGITLPALVARQSTFFAAYRTAGGQLTLTVVIGLVAAGLVWLARLARFDHPARFLHTTATSPSSSSLSGGGS